MLDVSAIREQFPALRSPNRERPIVYFDSAATYLKPLPVIDAVSECYRRTAGTIGRGVHVLAEEAAAEYRQARETIAAFINADADEIVFVRNATEAINLVASSLDPQSVVAGSIGAHHSNLLPWRERHQFAPVPLTPEGQFDSTSLQQLLTESQPCLTTFSTIDNALGAIQPVALLTEMAHAAGSDVLLDASQSIAHETVDVRQLDCDYLCFSGHKLGGPTGIGVLFAKRDRLEKLRPNLLGGGMVESVSDLEIKLSEIPMRLEAGTPAFEAAIGLAAACDFLEDIGLETIRDHERMLTQKLLDKLESVPRIAIVGPKNPDLRGSIVSFHVEGLEAHGAARMLSNRANICVRSGFHCAQPAHESLGMRPTVRASFGAYNDSEEIGILAETLHQITKNLH